MLRFRSLPVLAVRRMRGNWRLLSSVVVGTLIAAAIISATAIYADAIRDLGLRFALEQRPLTRLDLRIHQSNLPVGVREYRASQERIETAAAQALGPARASTVRMARTATFFPTSEGGYPDLDDAERERANLYFRSDLDAHVDVVAGSLPDPALAGHEGRIPVAIGAETAARLGIAVGARYDLLPFWDEEHPLVEVEVVGLIAVRDARERYWGEEGFIVDARERSWQTLLFMIPEPTFFGALQERIRSLSTDYETVQQVQFDGVNARNAPDIANAVGGLEQRLSGTETRISVDTDLVDVLRGFDQRLFFTRIPLLVLLLQIGGIVGYYLMMVSTMLVERQAAEIATLRSRGATTAQILAQYGIEGLILALLAAATGPPIAAAVISALGPTPAFEALSDGGPLDVHISRASYILAGLGALLAFTTLMFPAWQATRTTVVEFKRNTARPRRTPFILRYYIDVAAVLVLGLVFWRLSREEQLFSEGIFGDTQADPFLLTTPSVFMLTVGVVFLRLFPVVLRGVAWLVGLTSSVAILVGMRSLVRNPTHYTRLILLLMFATGVGMFGATFSATLDRSYSDRAAYATGADLRVEGMRGLSETGPAGFIDAVSRAPADAVSPVARYDGYVQAGRALEAVQFLGVDPETFGEVAFFREDFAGESLDGMLEGIAANAPLVDTLTLPADTRQIGLWVRVADLRGPLTVAVYLRDATGRPIDVALAFVTPGARATEGWRFFAADVTRPLTRFGAQLDRAPYVPPLALDAIYVSSTSRIAAQRGSIVFGGVYTTTEAPPLPLPGADDRSVYESSRAFGDARLATDLDPERFEPIEGYRPGGVTDRVREVFDDPPPDGGRAIGFSWLDSGRSPRIRGLRLRTDGEPLALYLSSALATSSGLDPGDTATVTIASRFFTARILGTFDLFPTFDATLNDRAFAIVHGGRLIGEIASTPTDRAVSYTEAWVATREPEAARLYFEDALGAQEVLDLEQEIVLQQEDPLVAAGWAGILAISFGAVLLLSAIGFVVYSYLTAQERGLEFAILRTLGFSRPQIFTQVVFEHFFVIAAGMGLGTLVGLQIGRFMMDFLATDETGSEVLPPFLMQVSWPEIFLVWGILGGVFVLTISAVVLLYFRLAVHRALRIGDV